MKTNLYDLNLEQINTIVEDLGEPTFRSKQIWQGLYQNLWQSMDDFTPLPLPFRDHLSQHYCLGSLTRETEISSRDGFTQKYLYRLEDGAAIETVLMAYDNRQTVCISSQVGCAMGCGFCATGNMGLIRNLSQGEIIEQVIKTESLLSLQGKTLTNVVLMGMGEPFHNYQSVMDAIRLLNDPDGFGMGMRRFTISTVGLVPGIKKFTTEKTQINLAISLHAADDGLRSSIVPGNKKYPIKDLLAACDEYIKITHRRVTIEWALIDRINDSLDQARKLANLLADKQYHVNLIQLNPVDHYQGLPSPDQQARDFKGILTSAGIPCTIRLRRGIDIQAGCGQLASDAN
ncbi:MAG: 23S rRNA (adenine(2503)-C(2))-methyltransferase RlmN [Anaerolineales bacterium]|nr:MAG: 23S rRNA (adenine(2503)-C(2))-methyltransferase RlmN [Anaerolineales bacterium]